MAQDLAIVAGKVNVPDHIRRLLGDQPSDIVELSTQVPSLTFMGKVWSINQGSTKTRLISINEDGDEVPLASFPAVILGYTKTRGRNYWEGQFDPSNPSPPDCWSADGIKPDDSVENKVSPKCNGCPMSIKGSRTDGEIKAVACAEYRLLAVVPARKLDGSVPPLRMKIAVTSDYDGQSKDAQERGLYAFSNYLSWCKARQFPHLKAMVTTMSFDASKAYPKIFFKAKGWLDEGEIEAVLKLIEEHPLEAILGGTPTTVGDTSASVEQTETVPTEQAAGTTAAKGGATKRQTKKADTKVADATPAAPTEQVQTAADVGDADMSGRMSEPEEDEDERQMRLLQEKMNAKKAAAAKGNGAATNGAAPSGGATQAAPETRKPIEGQKVSDDVAALLGEWG